MTLKELKSMDVKIPKPEYPRPDWQREDWMNLNGVWSFSLQEERLEQYNLRTFLTSYDKEIIVPFSWSSPLSGIGENVKGTGWYMRAVDWQPINLNDLIYLRFGAVDYECEVWINDQYIGKHLGGYGDFEFEVSPYWNHDGSNTIVVRASDLDEAYQARGKQGYGEIRGIWQTVWLEARPKTFIRTAKFETKLNGEVKVALQLEALEAAAAAALITFNFTNDQLQHNYTLELERGMNEYTATFIVKNPELWTPDHPYLYEGTITLTTEACKDVVHTYFGIREISSKAFDNRNYRWITLNNKPIYLNGTLDQSYHPTGFFTYPTDDDMRQEIFLLKRLGLNFVRIHIKPEEPRKLYWADKLGILVMEDMPCFWGEPNERAKASYEQEAREIITRDWNHPSIFSWVMFNETWGLFSDGMTDSLTSGSDKQRSYLPDTQGWVHQMYLWAKSIDETRLVEDNSPCNWDHVETDINTWHFYINGYEQVRDHVREVVDKTYPGSKFNYIGDNKQSDAPLMNSECGNVWGIEGGAGDSDLAWHYHYMINEFRKHEKLCGFVFTEFKDVTNEFNGYYRIDGADKHFGYDAFVPGMSIADLHTADFVVIDAPPSQTVAINSMQTIKLLGSSFSELYHGQNLQLRWELWHNSLGLRVVDHADEKTIYWKGYGTFELPTIEVKMPNEDAVAILAITLVCNNEVITRNFTTFDVRSQHSNGLYNINGQQVSVSVTKYVNSSFNIAWDSLQNSKQSGGGAGSFTYEFTLPDASQEKRIGNAELIFEAASKRLLVRDIQGAKLVHHNINMMHGADAQVELNPNTYYMTDEEKHPSMLEVWVENQLIETIMLPDDPADSRGVLSWHNQQAANRLEDAGSYGYLCRITLPSRVVAIIQDTRRCQVELRVNDGGITLYGRHAGRYPIDLMLRYSN